MNIFLLCFLFGINIPMLFAIDDMERKEKSEYYTRMTNAAIASTVGSVVGVVSGVGVPAAVGAGISALALTYGLDKISPQLGEFKWVIPMGLHIGYAWCTQGVPYVITPLASCAAGMLGYSLADGAASRVIPNKKSNTRKVIAALGSAVASLGCASLTSYLMNTMVPGVLGQPNNRECESELSVCPRPNNYQTSDGRQVVNPLCLDYSSLDTITFDQISDDFSLPVAISLNDNATITNGEFSVPWSEAKCNLLSCLAVADGEQSLSERLTCYFPISTDQFLQWWNSVQGKSDTNDRLISVVGSVMGTVATVAAIVFSVGGGYYVIKNKKCCKSDVRSQAEEAQKHTVGSEEAQKHTVGSEEYTAPGCLARCRRAHDADAESNSDARSGDNQHEDIKFADKRSESWTKIDDWGWGKGGGS